MIRVLLSIGLFTTLCGCQAIGFMVMGIKEPKVENAQTMRQFVKQSKLQYGKQVISSYDGYLTNYQELGLTTVHIFSRDGRSVKLGPENTNSCAADPLTFISAIRKGQLYELSSDSLVLDSVVNRCLLPDGRRFQYRRPDAVDFVAVVTWAKWLGKKILDRDVSTCMQALKDNKEVVFDLIVVNMDKQAVWGPANLSKVKLTRTSMEVLQ